MRSTRSCSVRGLGATSIAALVAVVVGCTHEVDRFQAHQNGQPIGTIGSGPAGDDGDADEDESGDEESEGSSGGAPASDDGGPSTAEGGEVGGTAPATDEGGEVESGGAVETGSGDPVLDACLEIAATECETCACNLCLDPLYACQQDVGCVAMRDCAQQTGCVGADCLEPCGAVIDMYGGPFGSSGALALELSDCLSATCPACF